MKPPWRPLALAALLFTAATPTFYGSLVVPVGGTLTVSGQTGCAQFNGSGVAQGTGLNCGSGGGGGVATVAAGTNISLTGTGTNPIVNTVTAPTFTGLVTGNGFSTSGSIGFSTAATYTTSAVACCNAGFLASGTNIASYPFTFPNQSTGAGASHQTQLFADSSITLGSLHADVFGVYDEGRGPVAILDHLGDLVTLASVQSPAMIATVAGGGFSVSGTGANCSFQFPNQSVNAGSALFTDLCANTSVTLNGVPASIFGILDQGFGYLATLDSTGNLSAKNSLVAPFTTLTGSTPIVLTGTGTNAITSATTSGTALTIRSAGTTETNILDLFAGANPEWTISKGGTQNWYGNTIGLNGTTATTFLNTVGPTIFENFSTGDIMDWKQGSTTYGAMGNHGALQIAPTINGTNTLGYVLPVYSSSGATVGTGTAHVLITNDVTTLNGNCTTFTLCTLTNASQALTGSAVLANGSNCSGSEADGNLQFATTAFPNVGGTAINFKAFNITTGTISTGTAISIAAICVGS